MNGTPLHVRRWHQVELFARQLGVDPFCLEAATSAVWSNLNPQSVTWDQALSVAGVALKAAEEAAGAPV